jgi:hypothetical protein
VSYLEVLAILGRWELVEERTEVGLGEKRPGRPGKAREA